MNQSRSSLEHVLETHIRTLALTLRRNTVINYRGVARRFLCYLRGIYSGRPQQDALTG